MIKDFNWGTFAIELLVQNGRKAAAERRQLQELIVEIALAIDVPCDKFKSNIVQEQYLELGERIKKKLAR